MQLTKLATLLGFATMAIGACALTQQSISAQQSAPAQQSVNARLSVPQSIPPDPSETAPQELGLRTVVGCFSDNAGTFILAGGGPHPKQFRIISGELAGLKGKNGHTLRVVGIVAKNDPVENQTALYNAGSTTGAGYLTISAQKIAEVYDNCSAIGQEWPGDHK
jgi:hypothetical protein